MTIERTHDERIIMPDGLGFGEVGLYGISSSSKPSPPFPRFPKIPRFNRQWIITEKIDGTNGIINIFEGTLPNDGPFYVQAGSRNRWIAPGQTDNHGFAAWVYAHSRELYEGLGVGTHYGEWWGAGIGKRHSEHKPTFSLFNTGRWSMSLNNYERVLPDIDGLDVVPLLATATSYDELSYTIRRCLENLRAVGSLADPLCRRPEGIVVYSVAAGDYYKITLEGDEAPKGTDRTE